MIERRSAYYRLCGDFTVSRPCDGNSSAAETSKSNIQSVRRSSGVGPVRQSAALSFPRLLRVLLSFLSLVFIATSTCSDASAQPAAGNYGKTEGTDADPDINPTTAYSIRKNYFKRFPFAQKAFDMDKKSKVSRGGVVENEGNQSFLDGMFGGSAPSWMSDMMGGSDQASVASNQPNPERLQKSDPPSAGRQVTAYTPMVKFCNDNPYQGVCYFQAGMGMDTPAAARDMELFDNTLTTFGYPVSDTQFQLIQRENFQRLLELMYDPERAMWTASGAANMQATSMSNSLAGVAEQAFNQCIEYIMNGDSGNHTLINVANEESALNPSGWTGRRGNASGINNVLYKPVAAAVWMVQEMYRQVFVPMAILFLLPGAVVSQVKGMVRTGMAIEDASSPFEGILRSVIAVFLIPATQVIVSYSIDVGNSMAYSVEDWVEVDLIEKWCHELSYNVNPEHHKNVISPPEANIPASALTARQGGGGAAGGGGGAGGSGGGASDSGFGGMISGLLGSVPGIGGFLQGIFGLLTQTYNGLFGSGGDGLGANVPEGLTVQEDQLALSGVMQLMFNGTVYLCSLAIIILTGYQVVFMCYLYLMGPISAALYAWPNVNNGSKGERFRGVMSNWVEAVVCLSLWRFFWMLGLAIMTTRLKYIGAGYLGTNDLQWEVAIFITILALMIWSAQNPFNFDPGAAYEGIEKIQQQGKDAASKAGGGGGGGGGGAGGGAAPGGGGDSPGGGGTPPTNPGGGDTNVSATVSPAGDTGGDISSASFSSTRGAGDADIDADGPGSSDGGSGGTGGSGADGFDGSDGDSSSGGAPLTAPPPTEGGGAAASGGGGGADGGDTSAPPMASASDGSTMEMAMVAGAGGIPNTAPMSLPSDGGAPVPLESRDSGDTARYNQNATDHVAPAIASQAGSGAGAGDAAGGGNQLSVSVSGDAGGGDDSPSAPPPAAPPPPPPSDNGGDD